MNKRGWLACGDPREMLEFLGGTANGRKELLFAVACCRLARELSDDPRHLDAIEAAEQLAMGEIPRAEFERRLRPIVRMREAVAESDEKLFESPVHCMTAAVRSLVSTRPASDAARFTVEGLGLLRGRKGREQFAAKWEEKARQAELLRDILGLPFRPFRFDAGWLAGDGREVVALAREIDRKRGFDEMPRLAGVLERAGCRDRDVLDHCRGQGPHVRGCWVVSALLGQPPAMLGLEPGMPEGLLTEEDWQGYPHTATLVDFLGDKGTERQWRRFMIACCRRIWHLIQDDRSRRAIEVATRHVDGSATDEELAEAAEDAKEAETAARRAAWTAEAEEKFRMTARYARFSRDKFAAQAVRGALGRNPLQNDAEPGTLDANLWRPAFEWARIAAKYSVLAIEADDLEKLEEVEDNWSINPPFFTEHGKLSSGPPPRPAAQQAAAWAEWNEIQAQGAILRDLFGDLLGPPGAVGEWLDSGPVGDGKAWWCSLPTPRRVEIRSEWRNGQGVVSRMVREIDEEGAYELLPLLADAMEREGCEDAAILEHLRGGGPHVRGCWVMEHLTGRAGA
jgi:hypothetical protein